MVNAVDTGGGRKTRRRRVVDEFRQWLIDPASGVGERLPSIEVLAQRFHVSVGTMHVALGDLEGEGYLVKKHGSGMFVASRYAPITLRETAAVCMASAVHLYGELWSLLMEALQSRRMVPVGMDTAHGDAREMIGRLYHTDIRYFLVHLTRQFQWDMFAQPAFQRKPVIAFIHTPASIDWPGLYRVDSDFSAMAGLAAAHLWAQGHRRLLILGTNTDEQIIHRADVAQHAVSPSLARAWEERGGLWDFMASEDYESSTSGIRLNEESLVSMLSAPNSPTAIVGTRDVEVWEAQQVVRRRLPERASTLAFCGMFDTPWSRAGSPPFTTVSVDVPSMVAAAMGILDALRAGKTPRRRTLIPPKLLIRSSRGQGDGVGRP